MLPTIIIITPSTYDLDAQEYSMTVIDTTMLQVWNKDLPSELQGLQADTQKNREIETNNQEG